MSWTCKGKLCGMQSEEWENATREDVKKRLAEATCDVQLTERTLATFYPSVLLKCLTPNIQQHMSPARALCLLSLTV